MNMHGIAVPSVSNMQEIARLQHLVLQKFRYDENKGGETAGENGDQQNDGENNDQNGENGKSGENREENGETRDKNGENGERIKYVVKNRVKSLVLPAKLLISYGGHCGICLSKQFPHVKVLTMYQEVRRYMGVDEEFDNRFDYYVPRQPQFMTRREMRSQLEASDQYCASETVETVNLFMSLPNLPNHYYHGNVNSLQSPFMDDDGDSDDENDGGGDRIVENDSDENDRGRLWAYLLLLGAAPPGNTAVYTKRIERLYQHYELCELYRNITVALRSFPNLKQLTLYNCLSTESDVHKCMRYIRRRMAKKNELMQLVRNDDWDPMTQSEWSDVVQSYAKFKRLCLTPTKIAEQFTVKLFPCFRLQSSVSDLARGFDALIACGISPRSLMGQWQRYVDHLIFSHQDRHLKGALLEQVHQKYGSLLFSWFTGKDWSQILKGSIKVFRSYYMPKFTPTEVVRVLSSPALVEREHLPALAIEVIRHVHGSNVKSVPNLLQLVEHVPVIYRFLCDQGCKYHIRPGHTEQFLSRYMTGKLVTPFVYSKVLECCAEQGMDFGGSITFKNKVFDVVRQGVLPHSILTLERIGRQNVRTHIDAATGNTYLHVALSSWNTLLARHIIETYGIEDINHVNAKQETVLHLMCKSANVLETDLLETLLDMYPNADMNLRDHTRLYPYDLMLCTLARSHHPKELFSGVLERLQPDAELVARELKHDELIKRCQHTWLMTMRQQKAKDPNYAAPPKRPRDIDVVYTREVSAQREQTEDEGEQQVGEVHCATTTTTTPPTTITHRMQLRPNRAAKRTKR